MELNEYGRKFVEDQLAHIDEDKFYSSIGAYDPEALAEYTKYRKESLTEIALKYQDDVEFCWRYGKTDI